MDLVRVLNELGAMGIRHLMVEGGGTLIAGWLGRPRDHLHLYREYCHWWEKRTDTCSGPGWIREADFARLTLTDVARMDDGILLHWTVKRV